MVVRGYAPTSRTADGGGLPGAEVPGVDQPEGRDIFRNWVACGMPVVGQVKPASETVPVGGENCDPENADDIGAFGRCVTAGAPAMPPEDNWPSIHAYFLRGCANSICHGRDYEPLIDDDVMATYDRIVGAAVASGQACGESGQTLVTRDGMLGSSLLYKRSMVTPGGAS